MIKKPNTAVCLLALLTMCALPAAAQRNDPDAAVKALTKVIKKWHVKPKLLDAAVEDICGKYKKDPSVYNGAAEAFWWNGADSARAIKYADKAIGIDGKYAPAYVLQGNIWAYYKDTLRAKKWYEKAMTANPQSPLGYEAYAGILEKSGDPDGAVSTLEKVTAADPQYPFHLKAAHIYDRMNKRGKAIVHYEQVEHDSMTCADVVSYARLYRSMSNHDKVLEIVEPYAAEYSSDPFFCQMCLYTYVDMERFADAEPYAKNFFQYAPDSLINSDSYRYFVRTYMGEKKYEEAIELSKKWMGLAIATDKDKEYAIGKIADSYKELGEFEKAEAAYAEYISSREATGTLTALDLNNYAELYKSKAEESNGDEKTSALMKADSIYNIMANKFITNADYALYQRYTITIDIHGYKDGSALNICNKLISSILAKKELDATNKARLVAAYRYIAQDYLIRLNNIKRAKEYYQKIVAIDPNDKNALYALNVLKKY